MIHDATSRHGRPAMTSDRWNVVLARWDGGLDGRARFERTIVSEHADQPSATFAARQWLAHFREQRKTRSRERWDQVFVRRPGFRTRRRAPRRERRSAGGET